jgi:hypothetical protein
VLTLRTDFKVKRVTITQGMAGFGKWACRQDRSVVADG